MAVIDSLSIFRLTSNASQRVIALGVVLGVCYVARPVVITFTCALLCAFLLEPPVEWLVRLRLPRALAALIVCLLAAALLAVVGGRFYIRSTVLIQELPRYESSIRSIIENVSQRVQNIESALMRFMPPERQQRIVQVIETRRPRTRTVQPAQPPQPPPVQEVRLKDDGGFLAKYVLPQLGFFYEFLLFASFVPFLVYFMLSWKDHVRHGFVNLFEMEDRQVVHNTLDGIGAMARGFLAGNFLLGLFLAACSCLIFWYLRLPFPFMMGTVSGLLSVIPYVGLPLAMVPPVFSALGAYTSVSYYVIIVSIVAGLHLIALNVLYPKLVGSRVHLNPLAVTLAILIWTFMWGPIGLLLAIPITAGLKAVCDNVPSLRKFGELLGD
ncbi:MAG TPA: AI-2E family transporter [Bryobacterales bacterium]|nr:AI-2E family transporter [Bryobacterales bacterium]